MTPVVAIIGRPNVGKSTLFNRIVGRGKAIVDDAPGVTRDVNYERFEWNRRRFVLMDTGGYVDHPEGVIDTTVTTRVQEAVEEADLIVFLVDGRDGVTGADEIMAEILRRSGKPVLLTVNKIDSGSQQDLITDFYRLGLGDVFPVSGLHGLGTGDLLDAIAELLPETPEEEIDIPGLIRVCIIGRPNVGKSTLLNSLTGTTRSLVTEVPGTTRDPVDTLVMHGEDPYLIVDTAGIRRHGKISTRVEHASVHRAREALWRSEVALLIVDAVEGPTESDARVFSLIEETGRAAVLLVNKWDAVENKETGTMAAFERRVRETFPFLHFAPVLFISALTGKRVPRIFELIRQVHEQWKKRVPTAAVNELLSNLVERRPPPGIRGRPIRLKYMTQVKTGPPTFLLFANHPKNLPPDYIRFITNRLYEEFGFTGTPIRVFPRSSSKEKASRGR
jgi:GTP-binding protein